VPSPRAAAPERDIPASVEAVVVKAMAKKPADRYPGARALAEALRAAVAVSGDDAAASSGALAAVDTQRDAAALSSTLASHQDAVMPASSPRGARVRVVVSDAPSQPSSKPGSSSPPTEPSSRGGASRLSLEPRLWAVLAVLLALGAIAVGVWLGL
jgi:serine/threonine-protein kinase